MELKFFFPLHGIKTIIQLQCTISNSLWNQRFIPGLYARHPLLPDLSRLGAARKPRFSAAGLDRRQLWSYGKSLIPLWLSWCHSCPPPPAAPVWLRMEAVWTRSNKLVCVMNEKKINFINMCFSWVTIQKAPYWTILGIIELSLLTFALHFQPLSPHLEVDIKKNKFWSYVWRPSYQRLQTFTRYKCKQDGARARCPTFKWVCLFVFSHYSSQAHTYICILKKKKQHLNSYSYDTN